MNQQRRSHLRHAAILLLVASPAAAFQTRFTNRSVAAKVGNVHYTSGVIDNVGEGSSNMLPWFGAAAAAGDFNNDGWQDVYQTGGGVRPDFLMLNAQNGTFRRAWSAGTDIYHQGAGVAVGDYDGDGWLDIYVASHGDPAAPGPGKHVLWHNNGDGTFTNVATAAGVDTTCVDMPAGQGATFSDYDLDGDLDLYVTSWRGWRTDTDALGNILFQNNGDGTFTDVTVACGLFVAELWGFSPIFADMDGDRYPELMVAADHGTSHYFKNNADGTFTEFTKPSGTGLDNNGMGAAVGDLNNDGLLDWYVTAIYDTVNLTKFPGNMLYTNGGNHVFNEIGTFAGVDNGYWGWGTIIVDLDLDGWNDIVETNGWGNPAEWQDDNSLLFYNNGDGSFTENAIGSGMVHVKQGRSVMNFDYDNDGDQDVMFGSNRDIYVLFRNDIPANNDNNYLRLFFDTQNNPALAPNGIGTRVHAQVGGNTYTRYVETGSHYMGQSEMSAHFGIGTAASVDTLTVMWADGSTTVLNNVAANQTMTIVAP